MKIRTEFNFILPKGTFIEDGIEKKIRGTMRLAKVKDIIDVYYDARIKENPSYFYVILLTKVVKTLSSAGMVTNKVIESLSAQNFAFLVDFFNEINFKVISTLPVRCDSCSKEYLTEISLAGEF